MFSCLKRVVSVMWWTTAGENRPMRRHHLTTSVYLHNHFEHDAEEEKKLHSEHAASVRTQQYHHSKRAESWADYWSLIIDSSQRHRRERETARTLWPFDFKGQPPWRTKSILRLFRRQREEGLQFTCEFKGQIVWIVTENGLNYRLFCDNVLIIDHIRSMII